MGVALSTILLITLGETSSNLDIFFTDDTAKISARNLPSVFPYLLKLNDNGSYHGLRDPIRKLENHYPELRIYIIYIFMCIYVSGNLYIYSSAIKVLNW